MKEKKKKEEANFLPNASFCLYENDDH
jgi:hypothetical protein